MMELDYFRVCSYASDHMLILGRSHPCFVPYFGYLLLIFLLRLFVNSWRRTAKSAGTLSCGWT